MHPSTFPTLTGGVSRTWTKKEPIHDWGTQIIVTTEKGKRLWDAICGYGSYGFEDGLLEIMGDIVPGKDDVLGWLTADDVLALVLAEKGA